MTDKNKSYKYCATDLIYELEQLVSIHGDLDIDVEIYDNNGIDTFYKRFDRLQIVVNTQEKTYTITN